MKQRNQAIIRAAVANIRAWHHVVATERPGTSAYLRQSEYALEALEALAEGRDGPRPDEFITSHRRTGEGQ